MLTHKIIKNISKKIHTDIKVKPNGECFKIIENGEESAIKAIHILHHQKENILVLSHKDIHKIQQNPNRKSCDFIIFECDAKVDNKIIVCLCEVKSSDCEQNIQKALEQIKDSEIFSIYFIENCYHFGYIYNVNLSDIHLDFKRVIIIPAINSIPNRGKINPSKARDYKTVRVVLENGILKIPYSSLK